jgi:DNA polymerase III subunit delta
MGALTFDGLLRSLKQSLTGGGGRAPDPVYYLHGDEDVLKDEAIRALVDRVLEPGARDFNFDQRGAADLDPEAFHALVNTPPMLAAMRAVVIRGLEELTKTSKVRRDLLGYLGSPNPTTLLILVQGAGAPVDPEVARAATSVAVEPLPPARVRRWVAHRAGQMALALEPDAAELLVAAVGSDLGALAQELEKLAAFVAGREGKAGGAGEPATAQDVAALVGVRHGETVEDLLDAALGRRAAAAAGLVEPVLEQAGMTGVRVLTALGTALVGTALARAELDRGTPRGRLESVLLGHLRAARPYGLGSWDETAARWSLWAGLWTARELRRALRHALDADRALKSATVTDQRGILEQLVLCWGVRAREAA